MASRITIYGNPSNIDTKRLLREMRVMFVDYDLVDPDRDAAAVQELPSWAPDVRTTPVVAVQRKDHDGSVFLNNPDEPTLRQTLYSEDILSVTAYWV